MPEDEEGADVYLCSVCSAETTVARNIIALHKVPLTRFPCPAGGTSYDSRAAIIDAHNR